ncbi:MAG: anti-sigma F factor [Lachnospiraceae bacterium]|jgi:stage II sporulation protein AB (anti-sigma F factor)|nr:anti-sigma F factor [Lachnospiraceae bacterium]
MPKEYTSDYINAELSSRSENEGLARVIVSAFAARLDPTLEELDDVRTAVSEAVTNAIIHGYAGKEGSIHLCCRIEGQTLTITVEDHGIGIADLDQAMQPLYTSKPEEERSGMGFTMMQTFMDELTVDSIPNQGTKVVMRKSFRLLPEETADSGADPQSAAGRCAEP